jgi:polar amino acid transport system substrate-binding protein
MNRNVIFVFLIGIFILMMGAYHVISTGGSTDWDQAERLYSLNTVQKKWLEQKGELIIGVTDDSIPFLEFDDSGKPHGLLKEYLGRFEKGYGVKLKYLPVLAKDLEYRLENGELDAAISMRTLEMNQSLKFTMPIIKNKGVLMVKEGTATTERGQGLEILIVDDSPAYEALRKEFPAAEFLYCESLKVIGERVRQGEGNAVAGSEPALIACLGTEELEENWTRASGYLYDRNECLVVKNDNTILFDILNKAVYHTDNAKVIAALQGKWTGISYPLYVENKLEGLGIIIIIIFTAVLCVFFLFYQSNKSLYEELQQRMELLVESQNEMQTTFDGVTYFMAELNRDGMVISINKALEQYLAMKRHKAVGLPLVSLLPISENEREKISAIIHETFRDEKEKNEEIIIGRKILEFHTFLIKNNKEQIQKILLMMVDVTEVRNNERQLLQNNKMIAIGQLAAGVAHEIRNPLGLIRNYCYVLKEIDYGDYINRDEAIAVIEKSVEKSSRIIDNLLNFSRLSTDKKELVNLQMHINATLELQRSLLVQRRIDVAYEYAGEHMAYINVEAVEIILVNLITNAVDAIAENGTIHVNCTHDGQSVSLVVSDNGRGIPPDVMDEIYNPFFTTKKKREGNGLGLYIVYNEVQKMGGEIKAESEVGLGTTFYIKIPSENGRNQDEQKRAKNLGGR